MTEIKVETTVYQWYDCESENVDMDYKESRDITIRKEIESVETFYHLLECSTNEAVRYVWDEIKDEDEWEEWGWYGPYAKGDVTLSASSYSGITWVDVVEHIAQVENAEPAGVFMDLHYSGRTPTPDGKTHVGVIVRKMLKYLAEEENIDTSYWTHGYKITEE